MSNDVEIIVGTYEEFLLGYKLDTKNGQTVLTQSFADKSHSGALKCLAVQGCWIATGATDDRIFIYDMRTRKQSQILLSHEGTINALGFTPDGTHLLSGGSDGRMIATRINTWFREATWKKAHNGTAVTQISCHPSGKMALSLGGDFLLRTWNLVKGRLAYKTNLKSRNTLGAAPDCLAWSPTGDYFTLGGQRVVEVWSIKSADVVCSQQTSAKPICVCWIADDTCLAGLENGKIQWVHLPTETEEKQNEQLVEAHKSRVKAICNYNNTVVTASSAGELKVWQISESKKRLKEIAAINVGCRPTCLGLLDLQQFGSDYALKTKVPQKQQEDIKPVKKQTKQERGVVTIEFEEEESTVVADTKRNEEKSDSSTNEEDAEEEDSTAESTAESEAEEIQAKNTRKRKLVAGKNYKQKQAKLQHFDKEHSKKAASTKTPNLKSKQHSKIKQKQQKIKK